MIQIVLDESIGAAVILGDLIKIMTTGQGNPMNGLQVLILITFLKTTKRSKIVIDYQKKIL
jgi:hypothetical protein